MIKKAINWKKRQQFQKQPVCQWGLHTVLNWHFAHFHIPSTRYSLLQLESTNYPKWRQMLLERLQQSLQEALHTPCTERGLCQHPACPSPAQMKGTGIKSITERMGPTWTLPAWNTKAFREWNTGRVGAAALSTVCWQDWKYFHLCAQIQNRETKTLRLPMWELIGCTGLVQ